MASFYNWALPLPSQTPSPLILVNPYSYCSGCFAILAQASRCSTKKTIYGRHNNLPCPVPPFLQFCCCAHPVPPPTHNDIIDPEFSKGVSPLSLSTASCFPMTANNNNVINNNKLFTWRIYSPQPSYVRSCSSRRAVGSNMCSTFEYDSISSSDMDRSVGLFESDDLATADSAEVSGYKTHMHFLHGDIALHLYLQSRAEHQGPLSRHPC